MVRYYAFMYFSLREVFKNFSDDGLESVKSSTVMGGIVGLLSIEIAAKVREAFDWTFPIVVPIFPIATLALVITLIHFAFIEKNIRVKKYEKDFHAELKIKPKLHFKISGILFLFVIAFSVLV